MSEGYKIRSLSEIVNEILSTVRSYYDAEYAYYIEKDRGDIETIYEWCDENIEWQRDRMKLLPEERQPKWMKTEITDTTARDYSVFLPISEDVTAVLAVVGVRRGGQRRETVLGIADDCGSHQRGGGTAEDAEAAGISELS